MQPFDDPTADAWWTRVRPTDPETSHAAAQALGVRATLMRGNVLAIHIAHPEGLTDDEQFDLYVQRYGSVPSSSVRNRRHDLVVAGLVADSGIRRPMISGRMGIVWRLVE